MATDEAICELKRQGNGLSYIIHVKRIHFNQMIENTSIMTEAEEVSFSLKGCPIEVIFKDLFRLIER